MSTFSAVYRVVLWLNAGFEITEGRNLMKKRDSVFDLVNSY